MARKKLFFTVLVVSIFASTLCASQDTPANNQSKSWSVFPIVMYDTDIGFGFGGKGKIVNFLGKKESFDLMLFGSTKGERTLLFVFSIPDFEIRQRTIYNLSLDVKAEYYTLLGSNFFGLGPDSQEDDLTLYTSGKREIQLTLGRGFSPSFVLELSYFIKFVRYYDVEEDKPLTEELNKVGEQFSPYASLLIQYDTSNSRIHPTTGWRLMFRNDLAAALLGNSDNRYYRYAVDVRKYQHLWFEKDALAFRMLIQQISGNEIPIFELPILGGGTEFNALRGYQMNRFQDKGKLLFNAEYRFPIWKRFGGNIFMDAGSVWPALDKIRLQNFATNLGWGLRYYLQNFVVRFDMGFSHEGTGIYFNFGHVF